MLRSPLPSGQRHPGVLEPGTENEFEERGGDLVVLLVRLSRGRRDGPGAKRGLVEGRLVREGAEASPEQGADAGPYDRIGHPSGLGGRERRPYHGCRDAHLSSRGNQGMKALVVR